jgi:hypothetical protein
MPGSTITTTRCHAMYYPHLAESVSGSELVATGGKSNGGGEFVIIAQKCFILIKVYVEKHLM